MAINWDRVSGYGHNIDPLAHLSPKTRSRTMREYTPRRAGMRWREDAPEYVLDVFDNRGESCDRYTVLFCGEYLISDGTRTGTYIPVLTMSGAPSHPQGVSLTSKLTSYEAAAYRYRSKNHRIKWLDLPAHIREHVAARITDGA